MSAVPCTSQRTQRTHRPIPVIAPGLGAWHPFCDQIARAGGLLTSPQVTDALVDEAGMAARLLPDPVTDALGSLRNRGPEVGAVLIKGVPIGVIPTTPGSPTAPTAKDRTSELVLLAVGRALGEPIGYSPEHGGAVVQNLLPTPDSARRQTSTSSAVDLEFHTETAFHPHRPHFLLLVCLKGDPTAHTYLCSVEDLLPHLDTNTRSTLSELRFRTRVDESFGATAATPAGPPVAVLGGDPVHPTLLFDADLMVAQDPAAADAVDTFRRLALESRISVVLEPGDLLVVDNHAAIHGRSVFGARFDGTDRWLQRAFVVDDLAFSAADRVGRIIDVDFDA